MIDVQGVQKSFGRVHALRGLSFSAPDGAITGLLGPNGAGKTTALRILYTVLRPDSGRVLVDGIDPVREPERVKERIGVLPHARGLYTRLSAREHLAYYGRLYGIPEGVLGAKIESLVDLLEMRDFADRRARGLSQGQQLKIAIARALIHDPKNVLLDEPTSGLDVMSTRAMRTIVHNLRASGKCVLFSTHVMQEVSMLCDRIVVVAKGRVAASGTSEELLTATGCTSLEDAFVKVIGSEEGLA